MNYSSPNKIWPIITITSVIITALVVGIAIYEWQKIDLIAMKQQIVSLEKQIDQLQEKLNQKVGSEIEAKFKLAIRNFWGVEDVLRDPQNKNKFYYISTDSDSEKIWLYDLSKDSTFQEKGTFNIPAGNTLLYAEKLDKDKEFRIVGIKENKLIFVETYIDDSPGPCFSPWLGYKNKLNYIEIDAATITKKNYIVPNDILVSETEKVKKCEES